MKREHDHSKKGFYCRYEGEKGQRHLEGSRLTMANRTDRAMRGKEWGQRRGGQDQESTWEPRRHQAKTTELYRNLKLG